MGCSPAERTPAPESAATDPLARAAQIHAQAWVMDAHADIELLDAPSPYVGADGLSQVAPAKMRAGGVDMVVMSAAVGPMPRTAQGYADARQRADLEIQAIRDLVADADNNAVLARSVGDLEAAHSAGKLAFLLGMQNALILGTDVDSLDEMYAAGVRVFALTHMGHNDFADSSRPLFDGDKGTHEPEAEHGGLSSLGRAAIGRINDLGALVDISQLSKQAALQVIELSRAPVIASHSNVRGVTDVSRNLSDEELRALAAKGGVIHIAPFRGYLFDSNDAELDRNIRAARVAAGVAEDFYYPFELYWEIDDPEARSAFTGAISDLLGPGSVDAMIDHIDYAVQLVGVDHVGIGTDFNHGSRVEGFADASQALNVTIGLLERGYSEAQIKKIWGENFLRVFAAAQADSRHDGEMAER
ncbi:MAG: membrane dipeptidase [Pseudomonadota bacterium]